MIQTPIEKILFIDIETVGCAPTLTDLENTNPALAFQFKLYEDYFKRKYVEEENSTIEQIFVNRAALTPEFAKIVCVSVAFVANGSPKVQSFSGDDENEILCQLVSLLERVHKLEFILCGHNVKNFDIPMLEKRMIINGIFIPKILPSYDTKPWDVKVIDTKDIWQCGAFGTIGTLELMCVSLGIDSPKNMEVTGNKVHDAYWNRKDMTGIVEYCEKDTVTLIEVVKKFNSLKLC